MTTNLAELRDQLTDRTRPAQRVSDALAANWERRATRDEARQARAPRELWPAVTTRGEHSGARVTVATPPHASHFGPSFDPDGPGYEQACGELLWRPQDASTTQPAPHDEGTSYCTSLPEHAQGVMGCR